jgi:hypothetical protein
MDRLPKACVPQGQRLRAVTMDFALSVWAAPAVRCGWTDAELFALHGGLIPEMARRPLHFLNIAEDAIALMDGRGHVSNWPRKELPDDAAPWWQDPACVAALH